MSYIIIISSVFVLIWLLVESINISIYGYPIKRKHYNVIIDNLKSYRKNYFNVKILSHDHKFPYIGKGVNSILFYGQIDKIGLIWRWSALAKKVDERLSEVNEYKKQIDVFYE